MFSKMIQPLSSLFVPHGCLLFFKFTSFFINRLFVLRFPSMTANQQWMYSISVHVDSWNFLCKWRLPRMPKSLYNAHTKLLLEQNTTCQSKLKEYYKQPCWTKKLHSGHHMLKARGSSLCVYHHIRNESLTEEKYQMLGRVLMRGSHVNDIGGKMSVWYYYYNTMYAIKLCILQSTFFFISVYFLPWSAAHSLRFTLTIFSLISSKVKVKSEHLFTLPNYIDHEKNIQLYIYYHGPFIK